MREKVRYWAYGIITISRVVRQHLQAYYTGLKKSLQQEWDFVQHTSQRLGEYFYPVEKSLEVFLSDLFRWAEARILGQMINGLLVKHSGIALADPTQTAQSNWTD